VSIPNGNRPDTSALCLIGLDAVLTRGQLDQLALHTDVIDVPAGEILCRAGRLPQQFVVVVDGYVDFIDRSGRTNVAGPETQIGGIEVLDEQPHDTTVVTRSACTLVVIFGPALRWTTQSPERTRRNQPSPMIAWLRERASAKEVRVGVDRDTGVAEALADHLGEDAGVWLVAKDGVITVPAAP
jgi:hypothetical protein